MVNKKKGGYHFLQMDRMKTTRIINTKSTSFYDLIIACIHRKVIHSDDLTWQINLVNFKLRLIDEG